MLLNSILSRAIFVAVILSSGILNAANPVCGDGITQAPEQCDDGNTINGDGCSFDCFVESTCGNNFAEPGEECDRGLPINGTTCKNCTQVIPALCGNGVTDPSEGCDPVSLPNACNKDCTFSTCGDRKIGPGEECDGGGMVRFCNNNCKFSRCGDGILNTASGEQCDPGMVTGQCNWNCRFNVCGDGIVNQLATEECDPPGNMTDGNTCSPLCKIIFAPTTTPAGSTPSGGLDNGAIIGITFGVVGFIGTSIPLIITLVKYGKKNWGWFPSATAGIPMNPNPTFQVPNKPLPTPGV